MNKKSKKAPIFITIIIGAFIILLILINDNGTSNENSETNSKGKLISVLEEYSFECSDNICAKITIEDDCKLISSVDFSKFEFVDGMYCLPGRNGSPFAVDISTTYNWKIKNLRYDFLIHDNPEKLYVAVLDETGEFSCNAGTTENCYDFKTAMLQRKNIFLEYLAEADLDLEDLK